MKHQLINRSALLALAATALFVPAMSVAQNLGLDNQSEFFRMKDEQSRQELENRARVYGLSTGLWRLKSGGLAQLVAFDEGRPVYFMTNNLNAAKTTRANRVWPGGGAGLNLTGSGVTIGMWDGGHPRLTHQEFGGRASTVDGYSMQWHPTHVAGTLIGAGVNPVAKGMAYTSTLQAYDWTSDVLEMSLAGTSGLALSNHSYGTITGWLQNGSSWYWFGGMSASEDANFGRYDTVARDYDLLVDNVYSNAYFYTIFKAAGNDRGEGPTTQPVSHFEWNGTGWVSTSTVRPKDGGTTGYDTIPTAGNAKNIITVGAVQDVLNYTGPGSVAMTSFSGWGPTDDGRIKPDLVANGDSVTSAYSAVNNAYATSSGTSMASPNAAGSAALVLEKWRPFSQNETSWGGKIPNFVLKGLLIHTADECGSSPGPDYKFGWGLMNTEAACNYWMNSNPNVVYPGLVSTVRKNIVPIYEGVRVGSKPVKVTICWTDPAGAVQGFVVDDPAKKLVHDLDLRIEGPGGAVYRPWVLDPANPSVAATTGINNRDNVEQVFIANPPAGAYKIFITHNGLVRNFQDFSILIDGLDITDPN